MVYQWKTGSRIKADADLAGKVCEELESKNNLTAKALVDVSRPQDAPLHGEFTWDDKDAAELYRQEQARHIIRSLVVQSDSTKEPVRKFFNIEIVSPTYQSIDVILTQEDTKMKLIKMAKAELLMFQKKYSQLKELSEVFKAIEIFKESVNESK